MTKIMKHAFKIDLVRAKWHIHRSALRLELSEFICAGLLLAIAGFYFFAVLPAQNQHYELIGKLRSAKATHQARPVAQQEDDQLARFYSYFQPDETSLDSLEKLHEIAKENGIDLPLGEYQFAEDGKLVRYDIAFPVHGEYLHIRKFLLQSLSEISSLALTSVNFQRQQVGQNQLDSEIRMSLYARKKQ